MPITLYPSMIMCEMVMPPRYSYALFEGLRLICSHISSVISSIYSEIRYVLPHSVQHRYTSFQLNISRIVPLHFLQVNPIAPCFHWKNSVSLIYHKGYGPPTPAAERRPYMA